MQIISTLGQKGGSGKSSMALGLAVQAAMKGRSVAVIDLDPQTTAANWSDRRGKDSPAVVSCQVSRLPSVLDTARNGGVDLAIVDTPGKSTDALIAAAKVAHFCLMPIQPQLFDIETLDNLRDVLTLAGNPPASVLINRAPIQGRRHTEACEILRSRGYDVCPVVMFARAAHGDSGNVGQTAAEFDPKGKAADEMLALYTYIHTRLQGDTNGKVKSTRSRA